MRWRQKQELFEKVPDCRAPTYERMNQERPHVSGKPTWSGIRTFGHINDIAVSGFAALLAVPAVPSHFSGLTR